MLLRSVIRHVDQQNWTAVVIDFLIVVIGVFIGLQVSNWNEERRERREELVILQRLAQETQTLGDMQRRHLERAEYRAEILMNTTPTLFGQTPTRPLTESECNWLANSHVLTPRPHGLPVLDELLQTGRFDLIRSEHVKSRLREYVLLRERARANFSQLSLGFLMPSIRHPKLIPVERVAIDDPQRRAWDSFSGEGYRWKPVCDVDAMRQSKAFRNELVNNLSRLNGHISASKDLIAAVAAIEEALQTYIEAPR